MVGAAADSASLEAVKLKLAGIAEAAGLKQAAAGDYLLQRRDLSVTQKEAAPGMLLTFPAGTKAVVLPSSTQGVKLAERYARTYRGQFELSSYNNALAVINELPFEQYLYSVVGGEMPGSWPIEALKAQAVAARSYAVYQGTGFGIAQVVDTTLSQAYNGVASEKATTIKAVDDTKGQVMLSGGKPVEAVFSSSAGGYTADPSEVWGSKVPYLAPVQSPDDSSENGLFKWYRVMAPSGGTGFIRSDTADLTGEKNAAGAVIARIKSAATNVRPLPLIQDGVNPVDKLDAGAKVTVLETVAQSNEFNWMRGPFTSAQLLDAMKGKTTSAVSGPIQSLEVASRGPSGRVMQVNVNGKAVPVKYPDSLRTALGSLPSTRFAIEPAGQVSLLGAGGASAVKETGAAVQVLGAGGAKASPSGGAGLTVMNASGAIRPVSASQTWLIRGTGNGHGLGMSQYGAKGLADTGYDYQRILKYYYKEIELAKDGS
ncbi:SpoIID/LytB domain-containing protein [Paenibacillus sp. P22]|uniref:SpoIID/LytB domain-containing protein n=2 Tax=Paenibacillus TaxID=44249 RepID=UPI0006616DAA|nr:SpoIID/LytB domain-containing protein [Paenibacillus sp. P22]